MKYFLMAALLSTMPVLADRVKETAAVCSSEAMMPLLKEYREVHKQVNDSMDMELWLMKHDCKVIDKKTEIEVLDYTGKQKDILKIKLKNSGEVVFAFSKAIQIEQPGQKNIIYKF